MIECHVRIIEEEVRRKESRVGDELLGKKVQKLLDQIQDTQRDHQGGNDAAGRALKECGKEEEHCGEGNHAHIHQSEGSCNRCDNSECEVIDKEKEEARSVVGNLKALYDALISDINGKFILV